MSCNTEVVAFNVQASRRLGDAKGPKESVNHTVANIAAATAVRNRTASQRVYLHASPKLWRIRESGQAGSQTICRIPMQEPRSLFAVFTTLPATELSLPGGQRYALIQRNGHVRDSRLRSALVLIPISPVDDVCPLIIYAPLGAWSDSSHLDDYWNDYSNGTFHATQTQVSHRSSFLSPEYLNADYMHIACDRDVHFQWHSGVPIRCPTSESCKYPRS